MRAKVTLFAFTLLTILFLTLPHKIQAQEQASGSSASFSDILTVQEKDNRVAILKKYLESQESPLAPYANTLITQADLYQLDWTLIPAIAGTESTFAKEEPTDCYNSWGYGIYGDTVTCFPSYDEAIRTIAKALRVQYMNQWGATDVSSIGKFYAASPTWAEHTTYFMNQILAYSLLPTNEPLSISQ